MQGTLALITQEVNSTEGLKELLKAKLVLYLM